MKGSVTEEKLKLTYRAAYLGIFSNRYRYTKEAKCSTTHRHIVTCIKCNGEA